MLLRGRLETRSCIAQAGFCGVGFADARRVLLIMLCHRNQCAAVLRSTLKLSFAGSINPKFLSSSMASFKKAMCCRFNCKSGMGLKNDQRIIREQLTSRGQLRERPFLTLRVHLKKPVQAGMNILQQSTPGF